MYFFKLIRTTSTFAELSHGAEEDRPIGDCFRTFMYATLRLFESRTIHTHSPAILLFYIPSQHLEFFDAVNVPLPLRQCHCQSGLEINLDFETITRLDGAAGLTPGNIVQFIACCDDVEMKNAIALMSGVVNFDQPLTHRFVANVSDNQLRPNRLPPKFLTGLLGSAAGTIDKRLIPEWKDFLKTIKLESRRPYVLCDSTGRSVKRVPYKLSSHHPHQWQHFQASESGHIGMLEYVFTHPNSLIHLLEHSEVCVIFVGADALTPQNNFKRCNHSKKPKNGQTLTHDSVLSQNLVNRHAYWSLRRDCQCYNL
jgi:hypothetical protein